MKNIFLLIITLFTIISCTQVVDIPLNTESPKLVVEANINWKKGTSGNEQTIKLTTTTNFYKKEIPVANGAIVTIKNESSNQIFSFLEVNNSGIYKCSNFNPILNNIYSMKVSYNGTTYEGSEKLTSVSEISKVIQEANGGLNSKKIRISAFFNDPKITEDYYLFNYEYPNLEGMKPDFYVSNDLFTNGNLNNSFSFKDDLKVNDIVEITHFGISKQYHNYLKILLSLSGSNGGGGPFQTPPVSVRGNLLNKQNENDYPYGYFSLSESDSRSYTIK